VVLTIWLALIFASFGYNAPRNGMMVVILLVCAASVAIAIFLIMEIDRPFNGLVIVSSEPIQHALSVMRR
jgi:peptidoglycan/LPS O-acetylase OafA/YrhL